MAENCYSVPAKFLLCAYLCCGVAPVFGQDHGNPLPPPDVSDQDQVAMTLPPTGHPHGEPEEPKDIRDIKGLIAAPGELAWLWWLLGSGLLVSAVVYAVFFRGRQKKGRREVIIPPHEVAIKRLSRLRQGSLLEQGRVKEFHFSLSETMRSYVEECYGFPATDRTMEEIDRDIDGISGLESDQKQSFVNILAATEIVKFTDIDPGKESSLQVLSQSEEFVAMTIPVKSMQDNVI